MIRKKAGLLLKRGDGPLDFDWNERYVVVDSEHLFYFKTQFDRTPRSYMHLNGAFVSSIQPFAEERDHSFYVESVEPTSTTKKQKKYYFSGLTLADTEEWRNLLHYNATHVNDTHLITQ